jgi:hypothetical protein
MWKISRILNVRRKITLYLIYAFLVIRVGWPVCWSIKCFRPVHILVDCALSLIILVLILFKKRIASYLRYFSLIHIDNLILKITIQRIIVWDANSIDSIHLLLYIDHEILLEMYIVYLLIEWSYLNAFLIVASTKKFTAIIHILIHLLIQVWLLLYVFKVLVLHWMLTYFWIVTVRSHRILIG